MTVDSDARQRGHVLFMRTKKDARPRRYRGLEAELCGQFKLARRGACPIAERVRQVCGLYTQRRLDHRSTQIHFGSRRLLIKPGQDRMIDRMCTDRDQRIGRELCELAPVHALLRAESGDIDLIKGGQTANDVAHLGLGGAASQPPISLMVESSILRHRAAVEFTVAPVDDQADAIVARDDCLKREPPQFAEAIWKAG